MLVEFSVSNFRSFNEEQTLSLIAGRDRKHPGHVIDKGDFRLLKAAAIYGANASGKSNLIRAIEAMTHFVSISATKMTEGDRIPRMTPFRLSSRTISQPSRFSIKLLLKDVLHDYVFSASSKRVYEECLHVTPAGKRKSLSFSRTFNETTQDYTWAFGESLKDVKSVLVERTRSNGLAVSRGAEQNIKSLAEFFLAISRAIWVFGVDEMPSLLFYQTAHRVLKKDSLANQIMRLVRDADLGIENISVDEVAIDSAMMREVRKSLPRNIRRKLVDKKLMRPDIHTEHRMQDSEKVVQFDMENDESRGTQRFFALAGPLVDALEQGTLVVVDEIDSSMHPLLTRGLLELFQSQAANSKGAQLVATTHDSTIMRPAIFRRDQVWLAEKDASQASRLRSLYDFKKPRSTESFEKNYLSGRYGAVPNLGRVFEDLEL
jgi:uncharacterized protein